MALTHQMAEYLRERKGGYNTTISILHFSSSAPIPKLVLQNCALKPWFEKLFCMLAIVQKNVAELHKLNCMGSFSLKKK